MSWNVYATCDGCGAASRTWHNRSGLWRMLSRAGWAKSSNDRTYCPAYRVVAERENRKLREKQRGE